MASTHPVEHDRGSGAGRIALWVVLVVALLIGSTFLAVALTTGGDARTGGWMVALPSAVVAGLCVLGLRRPKA